MGWRRICASIERRCMCMRAAASFHADDSASASCFHARRSSRGWRAGRRRSRRRVFHERPPIQVIALRWQDVDLVAGKVTVKQNPVKGRLGTPKSGQAREIALSATRSPR
jgi:hypothetical protein